MFNLMIIIVIALASAYITHLTILSNIDVKQSLRDEDEAINSALESIYDIHRKTMLKSVIENRRNKARVAQRTRAILSIFLFTIITFIYCMCVFYTITY